MKIPHSRTPPEGQDADIQGLILAARHGDADALGRLLVIFRPYLLQIANEEINAQLKTKEGGSDIVQQSFMDACNAFRQFGGQTREELAAWLRHILINNLKDLQRRYQEAEKRQIHREQPPPDGDSDDSWKPVPLVAPGPSPSAEAIRREQEEALDHALAGLSEDQRRIILMRHRDHLQFGAIGKKMKMSEDAARKVWSRAVEELRRRLGGSSDARG